MGAREQDCVFPPGDFIREEIEERGWTQEVLAAVLNRPLAAVNEIITGKRSITRETACELSQAFGTSPEYWMNLETMYQLSRVNHSTEGIKERAKLFEIAPVKEMQKRRWIEKTSDPLTVENELKRFYGVADLSKIQSISVAARSSATPNDSTIASQRAWLRRAALLAKSVSVEKFSTKAFEKGLEELRSLAKFSDEIRQVPRVLSSIGVRFVVVEHLPKTKIDGAAFWLDESSEKKSHPVIALSMRYNRIDCFWHTLCHELSHIRHKDAYSLDVRLVGDRAEIEDRDSIESRADQDAAEMLIPRAELDNFILRIKPAFSKRAIIQFAHRINIHPGIVAGQLQHRKEIDYSTNREMLVNVKDILLPEVVTDGWGT